MMRNRDINAIAAEVDLHWNTVYKWAKSPDSASSAVQYAIKAAAKKLKIELPEAPSGEA